MSVFACKMFGKMIFVLGFLLYSASSISCTQTPKGSIDAKGSMNADAFEEVLKSQTFVDKSGFIREFFNSQQPLYVTAPRGFGKSTVLSMLRKFAEAKVDVNGTRIDNNSTSSFNMFLDKRLEVTKDKAFFNKHFGQYPVLHFRLKYISVANSHGEFDRFFRAVIAVAAKEHCYLANSTHLTKEERDLYDTIYRNDFKKSPETHAKDLTSLLRTHHKQKCIVLIDDFDSSLSQILSSKTLPVGDVAEILNFLQKFLSSLMHHNENLANGLVTGCVRLVPTPSAPETLASTADDINGVKTIAFAADPKFYKYFGYTDEEMTALTTKLNIAQFIAGIQKWYGGYAVLNSKHTLYNMASISIFLKTGNFTVHWINEDDTERLMYMFDYKIVGDEVQKSLARNTVRVFLNTHYSTVFSVDAIETLVKEVHEHTKTNFTSEIHRSELFLKYLIDHGFYSAWHETRTLNDRVISATVPNNEMRAKLEGFMYNPFFYRSKYNLPSSCIDDCVNSLLNLTEAETGYKDFAVALSHLYNYTRREDATELIRMMAIFGDFSGKFEVVLREVLTDKTQGVNLVIITKKTEKLARAGILIRVKVEESSAYEALSEITKHDYHKIFQEKTKMLPIASKILIGVHLSNNQTCSLSYLDNSLDLNDARNATSELRVQPQKLVQMNQKPSSFFDNFISKIWSASDVKTFSRNSKEHSKQESM